MDRILLALDLGLATHALTRAASEWSQRTGAEVVITHALAPGGDFRSAEIGCLDAARRIAEEGGRICSTLIVRFSPPDELLLTSSEEIDASLVVMGWGAGQHLGSTARAVVRSAPTSLVLVGERFAGRPDLNPAQESFQRLSIQGLPPLARLAAVDGRLREVHASSALLAEVEPIPLPGVLP